MAEINSIWIKVETKMESLTEINSIMDSTEYMASQMMKEEWDREDNITIADPLVSRDMMKDT